MIPHRQTARYLRAVSLIAFLILGCILQPLRAGDDTHAASKQAAVAAMQTWLGGIDQAQYAPSWRDASASFQKAATSEQWVAALNSVRTPLGKCKERKLASSEYLTEVPSPLGVPIKGEFVLAQFDTSFENLAYAVETVCFEKAADGTWKSSGYLIKAKS